MNYIIFPKVLKGKDAEIHKAGRRKVTKNRYLGAKLDGISPVYTNIYTTFFATINPDFLKSLSEV